MFRFLFSFGLFLSASLLFVIQPMAAKILLPIYGGTPAVWTVCLLFFQTLLLVSYGYAWILSRLTQAHHWRLLHLIVCGASLLGLPMRLLPAPESGLPELVILKTLLLQLGLPMLVVGASAPLLQYAYGQMASRPKSDPYFLYAASNAGSLLALLSYPWLIERFSTVTQQFFAWNMMYLAYVVLLGLMLLGVRYQPTSVSRISGEQVSFRQKGRWVFMSFIPCSLMMGVTFYITTDVAATPLFWVLPLALYLLSFVLTFSSKPLIPHAWVVRHSLLFFIFPMLGFIVGLHQIPIWQLITFHLIGFFMLAMLFHGELAKTRPSVSRLTTFYFCLAIGGVLAGLFNGMLAPLWMNHAYEYPIVMLAALLGIPMKRLRHGWVVPLLIGMVLLINFYLPDAGGLHWIKEHHVLEILALAALFIWVRSAPSLFAGMSVLFLFVLVPGFKSHEILSQQRNFYGIKQVFAQKGAHVLMSQSTIHGFQVQDGTHASDGARAYYGPVMPIVERLQLTHPSVRAMVMGLGTGMMACQFRTQDFVTLVEIDRQVIDIAKNPNLFTYLKDCADHASVVEGDGRMVIQQAADASYDLLVLDAFSSDAIPVHLLTKEAFLLYQQKMASDGVILANISNRHLQVLPVLTAIGRQLDLIVLHRRAPGNPKLGQLASEWVLLTTDESIASSLIAHEHWRFVAEQASLLWTDDYTNLVPFIKWLPS